MKPKAQVEYRKLTELTELEGNPRIIKKEQFEKLKKSLKDNADYFEARPIILSNRTGKLVILAGNQRYKAAKAIGLESVPTILLEGLTAEREKEIIIRDNVENGEWNIEMLANNWDAKNLVEWGVELPDLETEMEIIEDEPPEPDEQQPAKSKLGEIYQLGDHRLMVGDSTKAEQVAELMNGQKADLLVTDPPYNVDYVGKTKDRLKIENDKFASSSIFEKFLQDSLSAADQNMREGAGYYIWHADLNGNPFRSAIDQLGWPLREVLIWAKNTFTLGRQDYQWQHESCLYGWKSGAGHYFRDIRTETTIFDDEKPIEELTNKELKQLVANYRAAVPSTIIREPKPMRSEEHPTMKPVKLIARLIGNSSRERERVMHTIATRAGSRQTDNFIVESSDASKLSTATTFSNASMEQTATLRHSAQWEAETQSRSYGLAAEAGEIVR